MRIVQDHKGLLKHLYVINEGLGIQQSVGGLGIAFFAVIFFIFLNFLSFAEICCTWGNFDSPKPRQGKSCIQALKPIWHFLQSLFFNPFPFPDFRRHFWRRGSCRLISLGRVKIHVYKSLSFLLFSLCKSINNIMQKDKKFSRTVAPFDRQKEGQILWKMHL